MMMIWILEPCRLVSMLIVNTKSERICRKVYLMVLSQHLLGGTEENHSTMTTDCNALG
jgi:hypothetical protein